MALIIEQDKLAYPEGIGLGCFWTEMFLTAGCTDLV
jgi:hypothetical protein